ncbi:MAG TPA: response regulator transcription factor [Actinomycetota bacterium]|nr:response regulator transcription factor [Actinomycetota bacterium]
MEMAHLVAAPEFQGVRVAIVADQKLVAEAIRSALKLEGVDVVAMMSANGDESHAVVSEARPDLIILDLARLGREGIDWSQRVLRDVPSVKILALIAAERPLLAQAAIRSGIQGCLSKDSAMHDLLNAIRGVLAGHAVLPLPIAREMNVTSTGDIYVSLLANQLTRREHDVLALLVEGASSQEMVRELRVSRNTVRTHIQNILTKLQVHSRLEAAAFAVRHGIVRTD